MPPGYVCDYTIRYTSNNQMMKGTTGRSYLMVLRQKADSFFSPVAGSKFRSPQFLKSCRISRSVYDGVLNVPVSKKILNEPRVCSLVCQGKATSMAEHVRVRRHGKFCFFTESTDRAPYSLSA